MRVELSIILRDVVTPARVGRTRRKRNCFSETSEKRKGSGRNHEIDRLGAFALLVRFDIKRNTLSFGQILQPGTLHSRDVDENVASAVIGLDEAIAALSVEELDRTSHGHRETSPHCTAATPTRSGGSDIRCRKSGHPGGRAMSLDPPQIDKRGLHSAATIRGSGT